MAARDLEQPSRIEHLTGRRTTFILQWGRLPLASGQNRRVQQGHPTTGEWGGDHVRQSVSPPGLHAFRLGYNAACFQCGLDIPFYILPPSLHETWKGIHITAETASWNLIHTKYPLHQTITSFILRAGHEYIYIYFLKSISPPENKNTHFSFLSLKKSFLKWGRQLRGGWELNRGMEWWMIQRGERRGNERER